MRGILTVIGLGPGGRDYLTVAALEKLKSSKKIILRTKNHPTVSYLEELGIEYESFDNIYEEKDRFEDVYMQIVEELVDRLSQGDVSYVVPGSPFVAENTVQLLQERAKHDKFEIDFVPATSFIEAILHILRKDPIIGLRVMDGLQIGEQIPDINTDTIITQVYDKMVASQIKLELMEYYPDIHRIIVIRAAGVPGEEKVENIPLYELDRLPWLDYLTSVYIPKINKDSIEKYTMDDLLDIMHRLRLDCPWDAKQTHESLKPYLIEEAYEVLEALDTEDMDLLEEELGDLLLQSVFHAQIASEADYFNMQDVITRLCKKLIYRHPHVFNAEKVDEDLEAIKSWEKMKRKEKGISSYTDNLRRIPKHLPALMRSNKVQKKAAEVGFDWEHVEGAFQKLKEEYMELLEVYNTGNRDRITEEVGDLLFAAVNIARFLDVNPELALGITVEKFIGRFEFIEENAKGSGKKLEEMTLEEMDILWNMAKTHKNF